MQFPLLIDRKDPMGAIDKIDFEQYLPKLSGHVTVELIDNDGNVVQKEEGHNFISVGGYEILKRVMRCAISTSCPNATVEYQNAYASGSTAVPSFFTLMVLTDDTSAESPTTETTWAGNVIGWGNLALYTGADLKGGTVSVLLSRAHNTSTKWVWEFANDRANGTFRSICLTRATDVTDGQKFRRNSCDSEFVCGGFARKYTDITYGGGYYWAGINTNIVYKIDPATRQEVGQYTLPNVPISGIINYDSGYLYFAYSSRWYRYNISSGVTDTSASISYMINTSYAWHIIGGYIYYPYNTTRMCRLALSTFTSVSDESKSFTSISLLSGYPYQIGYNGNFCSLVSIVGVQGGNYIWYRFNWTSGAWEYEPGLLFGASYTTIMPYTSLKQWGSDYYFMSTVSGYTTVAGSDAATGRHLNKMVNVTGTQYGVLSTRKLLTSPVTKTSAYKMRISYELQYS